MEPSSTDEPMKTTVKPLEAIKNLPLSRGAWTPEEDRKLAEVIAVNGAKKWKSIAAKAGLNRCGKSCRLRWLNYLRPNIKRGNISEQEEDLILRLHKLLGNRWSLIAGRLPGRTDNEIKNYWNSHLSKKIKLMEKQSGNSTKEACVLSQDDCVLSQDETVAEIPAKLIREENSNERIDEDSKFKFDVDDFFDFPKDDPMNMEWVSKFLELDGEGLSDFLH